MSTKANAGDWLVEAPGIIPRLEARLSGAAFALHRHETYAIGITIAGVQSFTYRRTSRHALPGNVVVLHPDEVHDGRAGDVHPFQYRVAYVEPADFERILGGTPLPFLEGGISSDPRLGSAVRELLADYHRPLDRGAYESAIEAIALSLNRLSTRSQPARAADRSAAIIALDFIEAHLEDELSLGDLEGATGRSRWQLSNDFRSVFGVSPYRYRICRRIEQARRMLHTTAPIADIAAALGFADQSHLTRQFRQVLGMTPNAWRRLSAARSF